MRDLPNAVTTAMIGDSLRVTTWRILGEAFLQAAQ